MRLPFVSATALVLPLSFAALAYGARLLNVNMKDAIPNSYIVIYNDKVDFKATAALETELHTMHNRRDGQTLSGIGTKWSLPGLKGFKIETDDAGLAKIQASPEVAYIEKEGTMSVNDVRTAHELVRQYDAVWGLSRISHSHPQRCGNDEYIYDYSAATGTRAYVIDTGIYIEHNQFDGRAIWGANFVPGAPNHDDFGHGTHVAGIIGGGTYGVAKSATLIAVKVLNSSGSGSWEYIISGIEWAVTNALSLGVTNTSVINMSLGGYRSEAVNQAVQVATHAGIVVVVSAGNSGEDSIYYSPASEPSAITVGAIDCTDNKAWWSNFGPIVDIFAPGVNITSSWPGCPSCVNTIDGTSMAAPHVTGLVAYLQAYENVAGVQAVTARLLELATRDHIVDPGAGSPNLIAYNGDYW